MWLGVDIMIDAEDVLEQLTIGQILGYYDDNDAFLDAIGIEAAKDYWGLRE